MHRGENNGVKDLVDAIAHAYLLLKRTGVLAIHCPCTHDGLPWSARRALRDLRFKFSGDIVWVKGKKGKTVRPTMTHNFVSNSVEYVKLYRRRGTTAVPYAGNVANVVFGPMQRGSLHPFAQPAVVCEKVITCCSPVNGHVLDLFAGTGAYGVAAVKCGRRYNGTEIVAEYADYANGRIQAKHNGPVRK